MRNRIAILAAALPFLCLPPAGAQDSINPDAAGEEGDGTQIVVPQRKPVSPAPTDIRGPEKAPSTLEIDADACRYAVQHVPSANTDYVAGVDVDGKPVVPADLAPSAQLKFPSSVAIPITSNVARMLHNSGATANQGASSQDYRADALIGMVSLADGHLSFNGQPIGDDPDVELAALCRNAAHKELSGAR